MSQETEIFRTPHNMKDEGVSGYAYRAFRMDTKKGKYVLISNHNDPTGYDGANDKLEIEFDNPDVLNGAIVALTMFGGVDLEAPGIVTRSHQDWDHSQASNIDNDPSDVIQKGVVRISLTVQNNVLNPFETTIEIQSAPGN